MHLAITREDVADMEYQTQVPSFSYHSALAICTMNQEGRYMYHKSLPEIVASCEDLIIIAMCRNYVLIFFTIAT